MRVLPSLTPARFTTWLALVVGLGTLGRWQAFQSGSGRCALDGRAIDSVDCVELGHLEHAPLQFCDIDCALAWPESVAADARWSVHDQVSGEKLDATVACFVRSHTPGTRPSLRAFRSWVDAQAHIATYGGERAANPLPTADTTPPDS